MHTLFNPRLRRIVLFILLLCLLPALLLGTSIRAADGDIVVLHVDGTINPVLVDYIECGIEQAEETGAIACIIELDTPGGLDTTMREIIQLMDSSDVPIIVYVPSGARAASAGFFITIAADVAAMAADTAIGAASPVSMSAEGEAELSDTMKAKITNDAAAYAIAIAQAHGRNAEWAESAVRDAASIPASEALDIGVIEIIAANLNDLVNQLDGYTVTMLDGSQITLHTEGADLIDFEMSTIEAFLYAISDPNIAYILLSVAMLGIMVEIFNPGLIFPGVTGAICGLLAFYSLGMLPVNYAGILLMLLAFALFVAEAFTPTFGIFTAGGLASLIVGSLILFKGGSLFEVNIGLVIAISVIIAIILAYLLNRVLKAHRRQASTGKEELIGKTATVRTKLNPKGTIFHEGEIWKAVLDEGQAEAGEEVTITKVDGLKLYVTRKSGGK